MSGRSYRLLAAIMALGSAIESIVGLMNDFVFDAAIVFAVSWVVIGLFLVAGEISDLRR